MSACPALSPIPRKAGTTLTQLMATGSKNQPMTTEIRQWPQTTQSMRCSVRPRADSSSLETPEPRTAPWTSETPRGGTQEYTSLGWREGLL